MNSARHLYQFIWQRGYKRHRDEDTGRKTSGSYPKESLAKVRQRKVNLLVSCEDKECCF